MNKITAIIGGAVAALALSACAAPSDTPEPVVTETVTAAPVTPAFEDESDGPIIDGYGYTAKEETFIEFFEEEYGDMYAEGEEALLGLARVVCDGAEDGLSLGEITTALIVGDASEDEAITIVAGSVFTYCPAMEDVLMAGTSA